MCEFPILKTKLVSLLSSNKMFKLLIVEEQNTSCRVK